MILPAPADARDIISTHPGQTGETVAIIDAIAPTPITPPSLGTKTDRGSPG